MSFRKPREPRDKNQYSRTILYNKTAQPQYAISREEIEKWKKFFIQNKIPTFIPERAPLQYHIQNLPLVLNRADNGFSLSELIPVGHAPVLVNFYFLQSDITPSHLDFSYLIGGLSGISLTGTDTPGAFSYIFYPAPLSNTPATICFDSTSLSADNSKTINVSSGTRPEDILSFTVTDYSEPIHFVAYIISVY